MRSAVRWSVLLAVLLLASCGADRESVGALSGEGGDRSAAVPETGTAASEQDLPPALRALCSEMANLAHEAYGGRPAFSRGSARLQTVQGGVVYRACTIAVEVDHFAATGGHPRDILRRVGQAGWETRASRHAPRVGEAAHALEREIDLCFVVWPASLDATELEQPVEIHFTCAVTDWDNVRARDPS